MIRDKKGKSIIAFPDEYFIIDIETTGLDPEYNEIIELCAIKVVNDEATDTFHTLIKPETPIDDFITNLTGITNDMVKNAPPIKESLFNFVSFINNGIIVGHNINFDYNFIYDYSASQLNMPFTADYIDTWRIARKLYPEMQHHRLKDLVSHFNLSEDNIHRAATDCELTLKCFLEMKKEVFHQFETLETFIESFKKKSKNLNAKDITTNITEFDITHPLYGKICVFTGALDKMSRKDAMQAVVNLGGEVGNGVTKHTNFLVLGNNDYCSSIKEGKSQKLKKAEEYKIKGNDIEIISENVFYSLIEK